MIQSSITVSLVTEAKGGPFVFWDDLPAACAKASQLGYDAIEIFPPGAEALNRAALKQLLAQHNLKLAALGTGAGWVKHKLHLTHADAAIRRRAKEFIGQIIDFAGEFGAPAIIGSMQGRWENTITREQALTWLVEALEELGQRAGQHKVPLLYEPLNRYETNLLNRVADAVELLKSLRTDNVRLLNDVFHMNIEEQSIAEALRHAGKYVGHIHFVDSNRRPAGNGHIDFAPIAKALRDIGFSGYASAEALPYPNPDEAAAQTMAQFRKHFPTSSH